MYIGAKGIHTTPSKLEAIVKAPDPENVEELCSFLGLLNYYGKFIPSISLSSFTCSIASCSMDIHGRGLRSASEFFSKLRRSSPFHAFRTLRPVVTTTAFAHHARWSRATCCICHSYCSTKRNKLRSTGEGSCCIDIRGQEIPSVFIWPEVHTDTW